MISRGNDSEGGVDVVYLRVEGETTHANLIAEIFRAWHPIR